MNFEDEKDYLMRMIKETVRMLISLALGKRYKSVELPTENAALVSGKPLKYYTDLANSGQINDAENEILDEVDYNDLEQTGALIAFYEHLSKLDESFLEENGYSLQEVLDGLKSIAEKTGYGQIIDTLSTER